MRDQSIHLWNSLNGEIRIGSCIQTDHFSIKKCCDAIFCEPLLLLSLCPLLCICEQIASATRRMRDNPPSPTSGQKEDPIWVIS